MTKEAQPECLDLVAGKASSSCVGCAAFAARPNSAHFISGCRECKARHFVLGPVFHAAVARGVIDKEYKNELGRIFPGEPLSQAHARVMAWADRLGVRRINP